MKTVGFWLLQKLFRALVMGVRERIDTPAERDTLAAQLYDGWRPKGVAYISALLARGDHLLDGIDGEEGK